MKYVIDIKENGLNEYTKEKIRKMVISFEEKLNSSFSDVNITVSETGGERKVEPDTKKKKDPLFDML